MRRARPGTVLFLASAFCLIATAVRAEDCKKSDLDYLSDGSTEQTTNAILDWADCIQKDQQARVGKYSCFIASSAGIQYGNDRSPYVGPIKPRTRLSRTERNRQIFPNLAAMPASRTTIGISASTILPVSLRKTPTDAMRSSLAHFQ